MADDIVGGLFGVSPEQLNAQRRAQAEARAAAAAQMNPYQRASYLTQLGAGGLMGGVARSLGSGQDEQEAYKQKQQMLSQVDMSTPGGILKAAETARQRGDVQTQLRLQQLANQRQEELINQQFKQAEIERMGRQQQERPDKLVAVVGAGGNPVYVPQSQAAGMQPYYKAGKDAEKSDAAQSANMQFDAIERNIEQLYDSREGKLKPSAAELFGQYAQYKPDALLSQQAVDAKNALDSLTDQVMITNLTDAKERVGQSFGSMQAQEWDKFTRQLISLKRSQSPKSAAEAMKYVTNFIKTKRKVFDVAMGADKSDKPDTSGFSVETPSRFQGFSIVE
jgi:hypothetical protein